MGILERGKALLWPERCILCGQVAAYGACCCPRCRRETPPLEGALQRSGLLVVAVWPYEDRVTSAVARFKFRGDKKAGRQMARQMAQAWAEQGRAFGADSLTFVPMPPERERQRGYNQARLLAQWAGEELNLPVLELLSREGVLMQHEMAASFRKKGGRPVFRPLPGAERKAAGRRILLVDDIVTTGGTVQVCAAQLQKAGAEAVAVLAAAAG